MVSVHRGVAQLVEYWSPKPWVVGSSPSAPAKKRTGSLSYLFFFCVRAGGLEGRAVQSKLPVDVCDRERPSHAVRGANRVLPQDGLGHLVFFCVEGGLEVGAVVNDSPVDCQSRE